MNCFHFTLKTGSLPSTNLFSGSANLWRAKQTISQPWRQVNGSVPHSPIGPLPACVPLPSLAIRSAPVGEGSQPEGHSTQSTRVPHFCAVESPPPHSSTASSGRHTFVCCCSAPIEMEGIPSLPALFPAHTQVVVPLKMGLWLSIHSAPPPHIVCS